MGKKSKEKIKVVLDTNILISAFLWRKNLHKIFDLVKEEKIQICATKELLEEFYYVLKYPKFAQVLSIIGETPETVLREFLGIVRLYPSLTSKTVLVKEDPSDDKFLLAAISAGANFVISGDKHLLKIKEFNDISIISAREFLKLL